MTRPKTLGGGSVKVTSYSQLYLQAGKANILLLKYSTHAVFQYGLTYVP